VSFLERITIFSVSPSWRFFLVSAHLPSFPSPFISYFLTLIREARATTILPVLPLTFFSLNPGFRARRPSLWQDKSSFLFELLSFSPFVSAMQSGLVSMQLEGRAPFFP